MLYRAGTNVKVFPSSDKKLTDWEKLQLDERYETRATSDVDCKGMFQIGTIARFVTFRQKQSAFGNRS